MCFILFPLLTALPNGGLVPSSRREDWVLVFPCVGLEGELRAGRGRARRGHHVQRSKTERNVEIERKGRKSRAEAHFPGRSATCRVSRKKLRVWWLTDCVLERPLSPKREKWFQWIKEEKRFSRRRERRVAPTSILAVQMENRSFWGLCR